MSLNRLHLMVRATVAEPPTDPEWVVDWLKAMINGIGMTLAPVPQNPNAYYCDTAGNRGLTAVALIETSNIALHTWDEQNPAEVQLDVFTCGGLNVERTLSFLDNFAPLNIDYILVDRSEELNVLRRWQSSNCVRL